MKNSLSIFLLLAPTFTLAQTSGDTLTRKALSFQSQSRKILDSIYSPTAVTRLRDSLTINAWSDGLRRKVALRFSPDFLYRYGDSLRRFSVPEAEIERSLDSLRERKSSLMKEVNEKQSKLQLRVSERYTMWSRVLRRKFNLDSAGVNLPGPDLPATQLKSPDTNLPSLPNTPQPDAPPIPPLESADFSKLVGSFLPTGFGAVQVMRSGTCSL